MAAAMLMRRSVAPSALAETVERVGNFLEVSAEIVERVDPVFFGDPKQAAMKALGLT
jgi:hypothetical protein